ncbi:MAG: amidase [Vicinamibacterales bacterium]|jgi:Asp-tRNA(Asn)/Glu-tRNA(Gln) amidotransferase A subunit family amidase
MNRRRFFSAVTSAFAAGAAAPALAQQSAAAPARIDRLRLDAAESIFGVDFTEAEEQMALNSVNRNLDSFEQLRKLTVPLDTEPAITFRPYLPGKRPTGKATPGARLRVTRTTVPTSLTSEQIAFLPVTALAALIESKRITSTELTKIYLDRLKKHGDTLKCVVTLTEDLALTQAADADAEIKAGKYRGPLHGIPWGAKDLLAARGYKTTWGATPYKDQVIDLDATVVERLRDAGAVLVAKLSMGALAQGGVWFGGSTRNPWNTERSSSGSSAGPGAATAAGLVGFSIGTETLGSIISPSVTNGVTGLRPTYGRVSRHGAMALSWTMDKIGPMCRSVEDCALVLNAIYGADGRDDTVTDAPFEWNPDRPIGSLRIGYLQKEFESGPNNPNPSDAQRQAAEARKAMYAQALEVFRKAGAKLEPLALPDFPTGAIGFVLSAEAAAAFDDLTRNKEQLATLTAQSPGDWPNTFRSSRFIPAVEYIRAMRARRLLMQEMDKVMSQYDVFLSPAPGSASLQVTNLTGHPALVLKCGFIDNMPASIMITGRLYDEATVCRVALAYEQATDWHRKHPTI